jgi:hypothetical protein
MQLQVAARFYTRVLLGFQQGHRLASGFYGVLQSFQVNFRMLIGFRGAHGSVEVTGNILQAGRSQVLVPIR